MSDDLFDFRPGAFRVLNDVVCPEAQDAPALLLHGYRSSSIGAGLKCMMVAINLNDELA